MFYSPPVPFSSALPVLGGGDFEQLSALCVALGVLAASASLLLDRSPRLRNSYPFRLPSRSSPPPECRVRLYDPERDFERCAELYRLNAPGRFPEDVYERYLDWLRGSEGRLTLVVESPEGELRAAGGVEAAGGDGAVLCFGMVHPAHHRRGFGEVLLLARLAALPPPESRPRAVWLFSVSGSETYYARFGFRFTGSVPFETGGTYERHAVCLSAGDLRRCRRRLAAFGLNLPAGFPSVPRVSATQEKPGEREIYAFSDGPRAGDETADAPRPLALPSDDATPLRRVPELLRLAGWPPRADADGEEAAWVLRAGTREGRALAVFSPQWPEPRFIVSPETLISSLLPPGVKPFLYLRRHAEAHPESLHAALVFEALKENTAPPPAEAGRKTAA